MISYCFDELGLFLYGVFPEEKKSKGCKAVLELFTKTSNAPTFPQFSMFSTKIYLIPKCILINFNR